jgi:hypothetical protein
MILKDWQRLRSECLFWRETTYVKSSLRAAEEGDDKQYVVCPKPADHTDQRLLGVVFPLI